MDPTAAAPSIALPLAKAVEPFLKAAAGTSDFWDDDRRMNSLNYRELKVGDLRRLATDVGAVLQAARTGQPNEWRCFHCAEVFTDRQEAARHFGTEWFCEPEAPACIEMLTEGEKALVQARKDAEREARRLDAENDQLRMDLHQLQYEIRGIVRREAKRQGVDLSEATAGFKFVWETMEGRALAAESALAAAPKWFANFLRRRAEARWRRQQRTA